MAEAAQEWTCERCGVVGRRTLGFPDFVVGMESLPLAAGDNMDVAADTAVGAELASQADAVGFGALSEMFAASQAEAAGRSGWSARRQKSCDRFHANLGSINSEAAPQGGEALLAKVDAKLRELGWPLLHGSLALEAGGRIGYFIPAFVRRFGRVVFVDASVAGLVVASKLAAELGLEDVAFVRADVTVLPFATGRFDFVHQNGVIEHVHNRARMLAEAVRVRSADGYYVCVSPNRLSIAPEPHFGIPLYGLVPAPLRRVVVPRLRGFGDGAGTTLRSLSQLRHDVAGGLQGDDSVIYFLPRHLPFTARQTPVRRIVRWLLGAPRIGDVCNHLLNVSLLLIAPQHIVISRRRRGGVAASAAYRPPPAGDVFRPKSAPT